ncbi:hypothetical protein WA1_47550 [Scytonema hofmannii PCC 7110]|uniref:Uncharacterized protein n=1 Tax=Scytonema hofmannii PCC 7110 TaxID=128403 RepID=A0A139WXV7_9CYAN|nr:hypothetical protein [Scytonema hofmannii]KYC37279.1 hypothetical protein WA1_47550 [Scytonema hofmannii PCC 7110]
MNDYLSNLVAKSTNMTDMVRPRLPSLFEPTGEVSELVVGQEFDREQMTVNSLVQETEVNEPPMQRTTALPSTHTKSRSTVAPVIASETKLSKAISPDPKLPQQNVTWSNQLREEQSLNPTWKQIPNHPHPSLSTPSVETTDLIPSINQPSVESSPISSKESPMPETPQPLSLAQSVVTNASFKLIPSEEIIATINEIQTPHLQKPAAKAPHSASILLNEKTVPVYTKKPTEPDVVPAPQTVVVSPHTPTVKLVEQESSQATPTQSAPTIHVSIGRIEVRATPTSTQPSTRSRPTPSVMSLEEYLRQRGGGK